MVAQGSSTGLYIIDDDDPTAFPPRLVTVQNRRLTVEGRRGVLATLEPPLDGMPGGTLSLAILVPRQPAHAILRVVDDPGSTSVSVYVFRWPDAMVVGERRAFHRSELLMPFWGLLGGMERLAESSRRSPGDISAR